MLNVTINPSDSISFVCEPENAENQDVPDTLTWTVSPDSLLDLTPDSAPSLACACKGTGAGKPGTPATITITDAKGLTDTIVVNFADNVVTSLNPKVLSGPTP